MNEQVTEFERKIRDVFDASVESLDAETRSRLNRARQTALAGGREPVRPPAWRAWAPAGVVAAALVAAVLWRPPGTDGPQVKINGEAPIELVELAAEGEAFELMVEDPEFYNWVADQSGGGGNGVG